MGTQLAQYVPVLMLAGVAVVFTGAMLGLSVLLGKRGRRTQVKDTAYECGMIPVGEGTARLSVKFYLVAMLFILFDIAVVFLYPWAVVFRRLVAEPGMAGPVFFGMLGFLGIVLVGYLYAWRKRGLDWRG
ncbi:MAG: NADH-quinone oxidoreductase subunit A [Verrucomicrobia bacterium]|nr:NADH-quinone oxidoreductase subunit A [Verrucomicrobiota bacterium]